MVDRQGGAPRDRLIGLVERILDGEPLARPLPVDDRLSDLGMSSIKMVDLMLAVESEFDIAIPESEITPENFFSIASIEALVAALVTRAA
jgi:acyl carrier protein